MIARFFKQLLDSCGVVWRTFRAFFARQFMGVRARVRRITSFSRQAAKLVPKAMSSVAVAGQKPTKREDFVETKRLFVAKSFLIVLLVGLVLLGLLIYFVIAPWMTRTFFIARLYQGDAAVSDYNGRVVLCYDEQKKEPWLEGRLEEGKLTGRGKEYDETGRVRYEGEFAAGLYKGEGKFYDEGVLVYEGKFSEGLYEGKGKLYENGELRYEGAFAAGTYQGEGTLYSEGTPQYEGGFVNGLYQGAGKLYENGVLAYEGEFSAGMEQGSGAAYAEGTLLYKGEFSEGQWDGEGAEYFPDGTVRYRGGFSEGEYSGEGTLYFASGQLQYKGQFAQGKYDQQGRLYQQDGSCLYEGGFLLGEYDGEGTLYLAEQTALSGTFSKGAPTGEIRLTRAGLLRYAGQVQGLLPEGRGTLYDGGGAAVYSGQMTGGGADLGTLLGKSAQEVRAAFGEAALTEVSGGAKGFSIVNSALGATVFCSYKTEESEPIAYYAYRYESGADEFCGALQWKNAEEFEAQAAPGYEKKETTEKASFTGGVPHENGTYRRTAYYYEDHVFVGWSRPDDPQGRWLMIEWIALSDMPKGTAASGGGVEKSAQRLDVLLGALGLEQNAPKNAAENNAYFGTDNLLDAEEAAALEAGGQSGGESGEETVNDPTEETPVKDETEPLWAAEGTLTTTLLAMTDYYLQAETRQTYEDQAALTRTLLSAEQEKLAMGTGSEQTVQELSAKADELELLASRAAVAMEKLKLEHPVQGGSFASYDMTKALFLKDPARLDVKALKAAGEEKDVSLALMDLELSWQQLEQAQNQYADSGKNAQAVLDAYAMGSADEMQRWEALCQKSTAALRLHEAIHDCARQSISLNALTGGMLASEGNWLSALTR